MGDFCEFFQSTLFDTASSASPQCLLCRRMHGGLLQRLNWQTHSNVSTLRSFLFVSLLRVSDKAFAYVNYQGAGDTPNKIKCRE
jgi:hypothetical protein